MKLDVSVSVGSLTGLGGANPYAIPHLLTLNGVPLVLSGAFLVLGTAS